MSWINQYQLFNSRSSIYLIHTPYSAEPTTNSLQSSQRPSTLGQQSKYSSHQNWSKGQPSSSSVTDFPCVVAEIYSLSLVLYSGSLNELPEYHSIHWVIGGEGLAGLEGWFRYFLNDLFNFFNELGRFLPILSLVLPILMLRFGFLVVVWQSVHAMLQRFIRWASFWLFGPGYIGHHTCFNP